MKKSKPFSPSATSNPESYPSAIDDSGSIRPAFGASWATAVSYLWRAAAPLCPTVEAPLNKGSKYPSCANGLS